jgi:hypothetical protein
MLREKILKLTNQLLTQRAAILRLLEIIPMLKENLQ